MSKTLSLGPALRNAKARDDHDAQLKLKDAAIRALSALEALGNYPGHLEFEDVQAYARKKADEIRATVISGGF